MHINTYNLLNLIKTNFRNNKTWFCEEMQISRSYFYKILNSTEKDSKKLCNSLISYCKKNNISIQTFIFFK